MRLRLALRRLLREGAWQMRRIAAGFGLLERALASTPTLERDQRAAVTSAMTAHDMSSDPDEAYYRERYWNWIEAELTGADLSATFLDAGCGSGRISLPLAQHVASSGGRVIGIDLIPEVVERARIRADQDGIGNVLFQMGDLLEFLYDQPTAAFGGATFLEVGFVLPRLTDVIAELARVIAPGGVLLASFRPQLFLIQLAVARRAWDIAETVLRTRSGELSGMGWQNWHRAEDVIAQLEEAGFSDISLFGIGICSGIAGDPLDALARPSELARRELGMLATVEDEMGRVYRDSGRYLLARARR